MFWKRFLNILIILVGASIVACLAYPLIQNAVDALQMTYPAARVFRRVWMISVIIALIVFRKFLAMRRPGSVGFSFCRGNIKNLLIGLGSVFIFLSALSLLYLMIGAWEIPETLNAPKLRKRFFEGLLRGALVSGLEEYIFRGLIFYSLLRAWGWKKAAVVTSLIFASLHFIEGRGNENLVNPDSWLAGFKICGMLLSNMAHKFTLFPDAAALFIVGMALCHGAYRSGSLWYGVGLHGGWVWYFSFRSTIFQATGDVSELWIGGSRLFDGIIPMVGMLLIFPATNWMIKKGVLYFSSKQRGNQLE
jgi:CAAX protease family protein